MMTDGWTFEKIYKKKLAMVLSGEWDHIIVISVLDFPILFAFLKIINMHFYNQEKIFIFVLKK